MKFFTVFLIFFPSCLCALETYTAQVVRVVDGDTIVVESAGKGLETIRVAGIDCPEAKAKLGPAATAFTRELVDNKPVTVRAYKLGKYRRTIADILLPDGRDLGQELQCAGLALRYD